MSSKNLNKKYGNNDKAEQEALKEVEIVAELAPNEKTRKEAEKPIETVEIGSHQVRNKNRKQLKQFLMKLKNHKETVNGD